MRCLNCGKEISDEARFCRHCGRPVVGHDNDRPVSESDGSVLAGTSGLGNSDGTSRIDGTDERNSKSKSAVKAKKTVPIITGAAVAVIAIASLAYTSWAQGWFGLGGQQAVTSQLGLNPGGGAAGTGNTPGSPKSAGSGTGSGQSRGKTPPTVQSIIKKTLPSLAYVDVTTKSGESIGSGFVFDNKGDIVTNAHVVAGSQGIQVKLQGNASHEAKVIGIDAAHDIAELRITAYAHKTPLSISKKPAQLGDPVIALGSPLGLKDTVTSGIISGMNRDFSIGTTNYNNMYQISAPIAPGNSGGPLVSVSSGKVIGIDTAGVTQGSGSIGFAIPITQVSDNLTRWAKKPMSASSIQVQLKQAQKIEQASNSGGSGNASGGGTGNTAAGGNSGGSSNSTSSPGITPGSLQEESLKLISAYYYDLNQQDYLDAYAMLGQSMQSNMSYSAFAKGYSNTLKNSVQNAVFSPIDKNSGKVTFTLVAQEVTSKGQTQTSVYSVVDTCGYEDGQLRIEHSNMKLQSRKKG
ncbi:trypsin-like peptidase domain-containing protein [Alicyclobacillus sp. SO9]|uniref:trypsin-like peptidase domain-containing protein n=1 Tax=Alicyclobacillus sp. SO9 TaxID=2665646 RepID=UPI0018E830C2|nr:trypsin-like peptidase domain-containing protein [Alicyclobacillus sp. SO9]